MDPRIPDDKLTGIKQAIFQGQKIQAIKLYRKATDAGLAEAKDAVEKIEAELRTTSPDKFVKAPSAKGCSTVVVLVCVVAASVVVWLAKR